MLTMNLTTSLWIAMSGSVILFNKWVLASANFSKYNCYIKILQYYSIN